VLTPVCVQIECGFDDQQHDERTRAHSYQKDDPSSEDQREMHHHDARIRRGHQPAHCCAFVLTLTEKVHEEGHTVADEEPVFVEAVLDSGARRPDGKARRPRIPAVFEGGARPPPGMPRP